MNLNRIYLSIIAKAKSEPRAKKQGIYYESHHIVPRSMGGSNDIDNLVLLTGREHFICHVILSKLHPHKSIAHAAFKMACINDGKYGKVTSRTYETLRQIHSLRVSNDKVAAAKKSIAGRGKKQTEDHIAARTASRMQRGKQWHSQDTKNKISESNRGKEGYWKGKSLPRESIEKRKLTMREVGGWEWSDERRRAHSQRMLGKPHNRPPLTEDQKQALRVEKSKIVTCPHCGKQGAMIIMPRWHFDNCKKLTP